MIEVVHEVVDATAIRIPGSLQRLAQRRALPKLFAKLRSRAGC